MDATDKLLQFLQEVLTTLTAFDDKGEYNHYLKKFTQLKAEVLAGPTPEQAATYLQIFANQASYRENFQKFAEEIVHRPSHRTINQHIFRLMFMCIQEEAKLLETGRYDDRNKGAVEACAKLAPIIKDCYLPYI